MQEFDLSEYTKEDIDKSIDSAIKKFESIDQIDMSRMQRQIQITSDILYSYQSGIENIILEAPTGFGKSILGFFLTVVLSELMNDSQSYILTSNLFLQDQYENDINRFKFNSSHAQLKGQSNYICSVNGEKFTKRACSHVSLTKVESDEDFTECSKTCKYLQQRKKAMSQKSAVFNYSYWLSSMNLVYEKLGDFAPFFPRALTIFDESHLLGDIVQQMFGQDINISRLMLMSTNLQKMLKFNYTNFQDIDDESANVLTSYYTLKTEQDSTDFDKIYELIIEFVSILSELHKKLKTNVNQIKKDPETNTEKKLLTEEEKRYIAFTEQIESIISSVNILSKIYKDVGKDSIVLTCPEQYNKVSKKYEDHLILQCTEERELIKSKVLKFTQYSLFMSATIGNIDQYAEQYGIDNYKAIYIESDFDFSKSPIYNVSPSIKMSYKYKKQNLPTMMKYVQKILEHHENERGLIHTGNFEFMKYLRELNNPRLLFYTNAAEKLEMLRKHSLKSDSVICGPSILEGVDLPDDMCRFKMFMKVPYQSLADKLTKRKMNKYEGWYNWVTMIQFLQGLGRGIRHKKDYAVTYLLDGSFSWFLNSNRKPTFVENRLSAVNIDALDSTLGDDFDAMFG